jgi:hypothetical protein
MTENRYYIIDKETGKYLHRSVVSDYRDASWDYSYHFSYVRRSWTLEEAEQVKRHYDANGGGTEVIIRKEREEGIGVVLKKLDTQKIELTLTFDGIVQNVETYPPQGILDFVRSVAPKEFDSVKAWLEDTRTPKMTIR